MKLEIGKKGGEWFSAMKFSRHVDSLQHHLQVVTFRDIVPVVSSLA